MVEAVKAEEEFKALGLATAHEPHACMQWATMCTELDKLREAMGFLKDHGTAYVAPDGTEAVIVFPWMNRDSGMITPPLFHVHDSDKRQQVTFHYKGPAD